MNLEAIRDALWNELDTAHVDSEDVIHVVFRAREDTTNGAISLRVMDKTFIVDAWGNGMECDSSLFREVAAAYRRADSFILHLDLTPG